MDAGILRGYESVHSGFLFIVGNANFAPHNHLENLLNEGVKADNKEITATLLLSFRDRKGIGATAEYIILIRRNLEQVLLTGATGPLPIESWFAAKRR